MELIGAVAGILTVIGFVPQAIKTIRTRKTHDLSLLTYLILTTSGSLWVVYGALSGSTALWVTNIIVTTLCGVVLIIKLQEK